MNSKKHKLPKRLLAMLLAICMFVTMFPTGMLAMDSGSVGGTEQSGTKYDDATEALSDTGVKATKTLSGPDEDGNYTITLDVQGTSDTSSEMQNVPADIVLVVDTSTSMEDEVDGTKICGGAIERNIFWQYVCTECGHNYGRNNPGTTCTEIVSLTRLDVAKSAAANFVNNLMRQDSDVQIGLYDFSGSNRTDVALTGVSGKQTLLDEIDDLQCPRRGDGTDYGLGLSGAQDILQYSEEGRQKFVIFISDEEPNNGDYGTVEANALKQAGVTIFTVGVDVEDNAAQALRNISSSYTAENGQTVYRYYSASTDGSSNALAAILEEIRKEIESTIHAGSDAVMTDIINTDSFEYVANSASEGLSVDEDGKTLTWNIGDITKDEKTVSFKIKLKDSNTADGVLHTNSDVSLTFESNKLDKEVTFNKGAIGDPTVNVYKVTYTDGVDDEEIFADQVTYNLLNGATTPIFNGTPTRQGYTFVGWSPEVTDTVTHSVTYTAQWKSNTYDLKYDANGGTFENTEGTADVTGLAPDTYKLWAQNADVVDDQQPANEKAWPTHAQDNDTDVVMIGWTATKDTKIYAKNDTAPTLLTNAEITNADVTVYAVWGYDRNGNGQPDIDEDLYTLTYDANGGSFGEAIENDTIVLDTLPGSHTLWSENGTAPVEDAQWPTHAQDNDTDVVMMGWTTDETAQEQIYAAGQEYPTLETSVIIPTEEQGGGEVVYAVWGYDTNGDGIADAQQIIITPADIIIYTGGQEGQNGFDGVVNENNEIVGSTSLPEPGFTVILPYEIKDTDVTSLTFKEADETTRSWELQPYDGEHTTVYKLVPTGTDPEGDTQDPVRVEFTKADGSRIISSDFTVGLEVNTSFGMNIYRGEVDDTIQVTVEGKTYTVDSDATATLTVRGTTAQAQYASVNAETTDTSAPALAADENTVFNINNSDVTVDSANVALLFDEIIATNADAEGNDRADSLVAKANDVLNASAGDMNYDLKYLDLVDTQNGNAWVKANQDVTIYWPLPEGTTKDTDFTLLHFEGLHRDMDANEVNNLISNCTVDTATIATEGNYIEIVEVTDDYVVIKTGANGFSPFALAWDADNGSGDNPGGGGGGSWHPSNPGGDGPSGLNTEDHFSYIVGYAEDYRTGEATDDESLWPVKPQNNITRAEVATIFYRLLEDEVRDEYDTTVNNFSDVSADAWYNQTVSTLSSMGIVKGYEDGTFRPNAPITRAEFGAIATRFFEETGATYEPGTFSDVVGDEWFAGAIQDAVNLGLIGGYEDGTVRPNNNITRAEACAIVNRTLGRVPDVDHLLPEDVMKTWPDNPESAWFYADMQEATNGHEYEWITEDGNKVENWTEIMLDNDWTGR